jgi:hypothetical protein
MVLATLFKGPSSRDPRYALGVKQKQDWYPSLQSPFLTLNFTAKTTLLVTTFPSTERLDTVTKPIFFSLSLSLSLSLSSFSHWVEHLNFVCKEFFSVRKITKLYAKVMKSMMPWMCVIMQCSSNYVNDWSRKFCTNSTSHSIHFHVDLAFCQHGLGKIA